MIQSLTTRKVAPSTSSRLTCAPTATSTPRLQTRSRGCSRLRTSSSLRSIRIALRTPMTDKPYVPKRHPSGGLKAFLRRVEDAARELRQRAGVGPLEPLDPRTLTSELKIRL